MSHALQQLLAVAVVVALTLSGVPALADGSPSFEETLQLAADAYDAGEYEEALVHYARARQIKDHPQLQLQVAVLHVKLGECTAALLLYEELVGNSAVSEEVRSRAEDGVSQHEDCKARAAAAEPSEADTSVAASSSPRDSAPNMGADPKKKSRQTRRRIGWGFVGFGGVSFATAAVLASGLTIRRGYFECYREGAMSEACIEVAFGSDVGETAVEAFEKSEAAVRRSQALTIVALGATVASLTTGIVLLLTAREPAVSVGVSPNGVAVYGRW